MPSNASGTGARSLGLSPESRKALYQDEARKNAGTSIRTTGQAAVESDKAVTILGRELSLRNESIKHAAARCGLLVDSFTEIAYGKRRVYDHERARLEKGFGGNSADVLSSENTPENRAKLRPLV
jgi:hypothetical protein